MESRQSGSRQTGTRQTGTRQTERAKVARNHYNYICFSVHESHVNILIKLYLHWLHIRQKNMQK